jgi:hypothetical protein
MVAERFKRQQEEDLKLQYLGWIYLYALASYLYRALFSPAITAMTTA